MAQRCYDRYGNIEYDEGISNCIEWIIPVKMATGRKNRVARALATTMAVINRRRWVELF